ncbi:protein shortage in chiasmata 1 ortholog [Trachemys scripta elegans]|uniref:protein shortage in chiasmata 1 ortholog n=1 Tax=Trachemys scripta elegans TaxID=31138 RepID=UPI00155609AD|nr:protein shortage in chiasmata 1 ortholog [Trachemys scripta elegans]
MLPVELESNKTTNFRQKVEIPSCLELKELLKLAPEIITDESRSENKIKDLTANITNEIEISKYCPTMEEVCFNQSRNPLECSEAVSYALYPQYEVEIPLTPPCRPQRSHVNSLHAGLQAEPISPVGNSILLTESTKEYLECLVWQSEKYQNAVNSLLLEENQTVEPTFQHHSVTELKKMLSVHVEAPVFSPLKSDWWIHSGLNLVLPDSLEQLSTDLGSANSMFTTKVEVFSQITQFQLEKWLEEKCSLTNQGLLSVSARHWDKTTDSHFSPEKKSPFSPLCLRAAPHVNIHDTNTSGEWLTRQEKQHSETEGPMHFLYQEKKNKDLSDSLNCKEVSFEPNSSTKSQKTPSFEQSRQCDDDSDLLSSFIMLRSKHVFIQNEEKNNVDRQKDALEIKVCPEVLKQDSPAVCKATLTEKTEQENQGSISVEIQASESQCQAYHLLEATATPVLKELMHLGILAAVNWSFATVKFDHTRFFLKQQEKVICDIFKQGKNSEKEILLFKHAALVHLLVTVRDLLLMCTLDTALGYLSKAKDIYTSILGSCLDNIWRQLEIVQYSRQKKNEISPKITQLRCQMFKWVQSNTDEENHKVLIITRMDSDHEKAAITKTLSAVEGLKAMVLNPEKRGVLLEHHVISSLSRCSCVIVHNQHIGADFPWTLFSLVVEYDYTENSCWNELCKNLNITYITFKTTLPETLVVGENFGCFPLEVQIPYVFLTSEGLLNAPEILQLLESKYNITFVERSCSESLQLFGGTDRYVVITIDERTAIIIEPSVSSKDTEESLTIPISKDVYEILTRRESCLRDLIEKKFGCMSLLKSIRCPLEVYKKSLKEGIEISVWVDDMTRHNADALVNAANEHLDHIGGLALALVKAGGPEIKQESKRYIDRHGTLTTGQIVVTGGGRLSCKKVIHTVGPRWSANESERCCHMLETAIINVLKYVNAPENNIKSVAIPAVSSGIFGFPLDLCAHVIVRTIKNFVELAPLFGWFKEIHLVNITEPTVAAMKKACEELLGRSDINSLQETPPASANRLPDSITINGLCLHIIRGHIEDQQTAVIVNSVVMNDDLSRGNISRAILEKAGLSLQKEFLFELQKLPPYCEKFILTKGYNLACKSVLHVVWSSQSSSDSRKGLKTVMSRCLLKIQEYQLPSISFPAIGTGVLNLPNDEVADIMIDEVLSFAKEHPWKKTDVYFVIHPNDSYVYKAFQTKFESAKNKLIEDMECHKTDDLGSRSDRQAEIQNKKTGPAIELIGNCYEKLEAAKIWIEDIMQVQESHLIVIENNHIFNLSKREHAELSHLQRFGVSILEEVVGGKARLEIQGPPGAIIDAVFVIENLLCYVQENNRTKQEELPQSEGRLETNYPPEKLQDKTRDTKMYDQISEADLNCQEFKDREKQFEKTGLRALKQSSKNFQGEFGGLAYSCPEAQVEETLWSEYPSSHALDSFALDLRLCDSVANPDEYSSLNFHQIAGEFSGKRRPSASLSNLTEKDVLTGLGFAQVPQLKKRRLTFEKAPGRSDGQTRLKFF